MKGDEKGSSPGPKAARREAERAARQAREAKALRANLRRRKAQAQGRAEPGAEGEDGPAE